MHEPYWTIYLAYGLTQDLKQIKECDVMVMPLRDGVPARYEYSGMSLYALDWQQTSEDHSGF